MIISHESKSYTSTEHKNGAYWYSYEIVNRIIPNIRTNRNWITINTFECMDNSIVFIHNNIRTDVYDFMRGYKDLILVCGIPETMEKVAHLGIPIYLPLSIDVEYVKQFRRYKDKDYAYVGRRKKRLEYTFPEGIDYIESLPRDELLSEMARYKHIYAVGRTALEGKVLGCEVLPYDVRFRKDIWKVRDNLEVIPILQKLIDTIDEGR